MAQPHRLCARAAGAGRGRRAAARAAGRARVRAAARRAGRGGARASAPQRGVNAGYALGADYPEFDGRPAGRDHRAPLARATSTGSPTCWATAVAAERTAHRARRWRHERTPASATAGRGRHADADAARRGGDDLREVAARPPRRACCRTLDVPERAARGADPRRTCCAASAPELPEVARAGDRAPLQPHLAPQLRPRLGLLPARVVHDEAQPEAERARRRAAGPRAAAPAAGAGARAGSARADVAAAARRCRRSAACRTSASSPRPARTASWPGCC